MVILADEDVIVATEWAGTRLDTVAAKLFSNYSRNRLQTWISDGYLRVNGQRRRTRDKLLGGERLTLQVPASVLADALTGLDIDLSTTEPQPMDFGVVFEDEHILIIDKPAGLVMHPAPGNRQGTLLNGLLHRIPRLVNVPRAGIVHRLDKDTTGLCVVAKSLTSHTHLVRQLQARSMARHYTAVAIGEVPIDGTIDAPIGRHPRDRKRMAVTEHGKPAVTHYQRTAKYSKCAQVLVRLESGRTHQIRVHMAHIGHSLLGDSVYGRRLAVLPSELSEVGEVAAFSRQALHACRLTLIHPGLNEELSFDSALPDDMQRLCSALQEATVTKQRRDHG
jgi:23S rRNA pseudouridine1911/1915/1917 synthase